MAKLPCDEHIVRTALEQASISGDIRDSNMWRYQIIDIYGLNSRGYRARPGFTVGSRYKFLRAACPASMGCNFKSQKSGHIVGNNDGESL